LELLITFDWFGALEYLAVSHGKYGRGILKGCTPQDISVVFVLWDCLMRLVMGWNFFLDNRRGGRGVKRNGNPLSRGGLKWLRHSCRRMDSGKSSSIDMSVEGGRLEHFGPRYFVMQRVPGFTGAARQQM